MEDIVPNMNADYEGSYKKAISALKGGEKLTNQELTEALAYLGGMPTKTEEIEQIYKSLLYNNKSILINPERV